MIALGLYKVKSSWKLYSRINNVDPEIANNVSKAIEEWEKALKYADEDEKDNINIEDFIPEEYFTIFNESKDARAIIDNIKNHPCAIALSPLDLRKQFGLMSVGRKDNKTMCVAAEGNIEKLGYLKLDILTVSVVDILDKIYKKIGIPQHSTNELLDIVSKHPEVYNIYSNGLTFEVNQMGAPRTIGYLKQFKPQSIYDLSTVVGVIRPGSISVVDRMMKRESYTYDINEIDELLSTHTGSSPSIIYQESIMSMMTLAGISPAEGYNCIKAISKKNLEVVKSFETQFKNGLAKRLNVEPDNRAIIELWNQIHDSSLYSFNSPHSLSTALDSLYMAYLKTFYKKETYSTLLEYYLIGKKRNLAKISECKKELESLAYKIEPIKFGQDNTHFNLVADTFIQSLLSMKSANTVLAETLLELGKKYQGQENINYFEIYESIKEPKNEETGRAYATKRHWTLLCKVDYFPNTNNKKLELYIPLLYDKIYTKKQFRMDSLIKLQNELGLKFDIAPYCNKITAKTFYLDPEKKKDLALDVFNMIQCDAYTITESIKNQVDIYGFVSNPEQYLKHNIFTGTISAISRKNNSIMLTTVSGKETWIGIKGDISLLKRKEQIVIFKVAQEIRFNKVALVAVDYITYK